MSNTFNAITEFITPEFTQRMANFLAENQATTTTTINATLASILAAYANNAPSSATETVLLQAGNSNLLAEVPRLLDKQYYDQLKPLGNDLLQQLFSDNLSDFIELLSTNYRLGIGEAKVFAIMLATIVAAFLGEQLVAGQSQQELRRNIKDALPSFLALIPNGMAQLITNSYSNPRKSTKRSPYGKTFYCFLFLAIVVVFAKLLFNNAPS